MEKIQKKKRVQSKIFKNSPLKNKMTVIVQAETEINNTNIPQKKLKNWNKLKMTKIKCKSIQKMNKRTLL